MNLTNHKITAVLSFLACILILFYKRPDAFYNPQFYGEEGNVFFAEAYHTGFKSIFNTCAGYFHLYPRLIFCLALSLKIPLVYMPFVCCYSWLAIVFILVIYIWGRVEPAASSKFFIAIAAVLIPLQAEILMNLTNAQWIMALFPVIIFSSTDFKKNKSWFVADAIILIIAGFTGPNLLIFLPVLFFVFLPGRKNITRQQIYLIALTIVPATLCLFSLFTFGTVDRSTGTFSLLNPAFVDYLYLQYAFLFLGKFAYDTPFILKCIFILILFIYALFVINKIIRKKVTKQFTIITFFTGMVYVGTTLISYRNDPSLLNPPVGGARNFYLPAVCCIWYVISVIRPLQNSTVILLLLMILFTLENVRSTGREELVDYNWKYYAKKIKTADTLAIPINPPGWTLYIDNRSIKK